MQKDIKYYLAESTIDCNDIDALIGWLKTYPRLTQGELARAFQKKWSNWLGRKYSVFCNSGSSANLLMYYALICSGRLRNKKVIVPSVGWSTTIAPAIQFGLEPIMCEADRDTFGLDLNHLRELLKKHSPAVVMMVQVLGIPNKMESIFSLQDRHDFILLEDACAAMGSSYKGRHLGTFGLMSSFSLYFGHQISTIEGGLVSTDDKKLYDILVMLRSHGWSKDLDYETHDRLVKEHKIDDFHRPFVFYLPSFNLRSSDLNAFIGLRQIDKMEWLIARRVENQELYMNKLGSYFYTQKYGRETVPCTIHFGMLADTPEQREMIVAALVNNGVETRIFSAGNLGLHPFWINHCGMSSFPMADRIHNCGLFLPNSPTLMPGDINTISEIVLGGSGKE